MKDKTRHTIQNIAVKANPITQEELIELKKQFNIRLAEDELTATEWCEKNGLNQSTVSNALHPERGGQRNIISIVARYVLDPNW